VGAVAGGRLRPGSWGLDIELFGGGKGMDFGGTGAPYGRFAPFEVISKDRKAPRNRAFQLYQCFVIRSRLGAYLVVRDLSSRLSD
jgi:hypothetical protein